MKTPFSLNRLVVLGIGLGFLALAFEVYLMHYKQLSERDIMWTPIIFGIVGGISSILIFIFFHKLTFYVFQALMLISIFVGGLGLYLHNQWRLPAVMNSVFNQSPFNFEILTTYTPLLAPSAFMAMGGLGILISFYHRWDQ